MQQRNRIGATRREVLHRGARIALALPLVGGASGLLLSGCGSGDEPSEPAPPPARAPSSMQEPSAMPESTPMQEPTPMPEPDPAAAPEPAPVASSGESGTGQLVTDQPESAPLVAALQYTHASQTPGQDCTGCQLYTPTSDGLGTCQLMPAGYVKGSGWCASWAAKVS